MEILLKYVYLLKFVKNVYLLKNNCTFSKLVVCENHKKTAIPRKTALSSWFFHYQN